VKARVPPNVTARWTSPASRRCGDFFATPRSEWTPDTLEERPYDVEHTRRVFAEANERWRAECAAAAPGR
jgi:hypothetical protein